MNFHAFFGSLQNVFGRDALRILYLYTDQSFKGSSVSFFKF